MLQPPTTSTLFPYTTLFRSHSSMNLGQAVAVCLYELARTSHKGKSKTAPTSGKQPIATSGEIERITAMLLDALRDSGYLGPNSTASSEAKVRRLVRRLNLPAGDAEVWLGMFRQIAWKTRPGAGSAG